MDRQDLGRFFVTLAQRLDRGRPILLVERCTEVLSTHFGADSCDLFLIDIGDGRLSPYLEPETEIAEVDGVTAARIIEMDGPVRQDRALLVPVVFRGERLGVLRVAGASAELEEVAPAVGRMVGAAVAGADSHSDAVIVSRGGRQLALAATMQWRLLPTREYRDDIVEVAGLIEPAYDLGGDAFDYAANDPHLDLAVFDGVGHGVRAALLASLAVGAYRHARRQGLPLEDVARRVDAAIKVEGEMAEFVTASLCRLDLETGSLRVISAGHPLPIKLSGGKAEILETSPNLPLGLGDDGEVEGSTYQLSKGDVLFLYSDGIVEAADPEGDRWGVERLRKVLLARYEDSAPIRRVCRDVADGIVGHVATDLSDDATILGCRYGHTE